MKIYITTDKLLQDICDIFNTPIKLIKCKSREAQLVKIRHYFFYFAHNYYHFPLTVTGCECGNRNHTTAINGRDRVIKLLDAGDKLAVADVKIIKIALDITDNNTLDYRDLMEQNEALLQQVKELKLANVKLTHETIKLRNDLAHQKKLNINLYAK